MVITNTVNEGIEVNQQNTLILNEIRLRQERNFITRWEGRFLRLSGKPAPDYFKIGVEFLKKKKVKAVLGEYLHFSCDWVNILKDNGFNFFPRGWI